MRFQAPSRAEVPAARFDHPVFSGFAPRLHLLRGDAWPGLSTLNAALGGRAHPITGRPLRFVAQSPALMADGSHYEARIWETGQIATREENWHDLFNALMWLDRTALKGAVNAAYSAELKRSLPDRRTRPQAALTHFDEAGALVLVRDQEVLRAWDRHAWASLLLEEAQRWLSGAQVVLFGHALLEHALLPTLWPVAKCLVVAVPQAMDNTAAAAAAARAIASGELLRDPQELRPLPLAGLPGWHPQASTRRFFEETPCFRQLRPGRRYPPPWDPAPGACSLPAGFVT